MEPIRRLKLPKRYQPRQAQGFGDAGRRQSGVVGSLADHVTVLMAGEVLARGTYDEVRTDDRVVTAYLGEDSHA